MSEPNKELVRRYFDLSNEGRIEEYLALLSDDFRLIGMGMPASGVNHDLSAAQLSAIAHSRKNAFAEPMVITVDRLVAEGESVVAFAHSRARTASGVAYANQYAFAFEFHTGRICVIREYCCTLSVVHVLRNGGVGLNAQNAE